MREAIMSKLEDDLRKHRVRGARRRPKDALHARHDGNDTQDEANPRRVGNLAEFFLRSPLRGSRVRITRMTGLLRKVDL
jgi:hypothetical protein